MTVRMIVMCYGYVIIVCFMYIILGEMCYQEQSVVFITHYGKFDNFFFVAHDIPVSIPQQYFHLSFFNLVFPCIIV